MSMPGEISSIIENYNDVFEEPKWLPPKRSHDCKIPLEINITHMNENPYKFPYIHKTKIKKESRKFLLVA